MSHIKSQDEEGMILYALYSFWQSFDPREYFCFYSKGKNKQNWDFSMSYWVKFNRLL